LRFASRSAAKFERSTVPDLAIGADFPPLDDAALVDAVLVDPAPLDDEVSPPDWLVVDDAGVVVDGGAVTVAEASDDGVELRP
jgi:hypothetical protein